jgi:hypothetical protein
MPMLGRGWITVEERDKIKDDITQSSEFHARKRMPEEMGRSGILRPPLGRLHRAVAVAPARRSFRTRRLKARPGANDNLLRAFPEPGARRPAPPKRPRPSPSSRRCRAAPPASPARCDVEHMIGHAINWKKGFTCSRPGVGRGMERPRWTPPWKTSGKYPVIYHVISRVVERRLAFGREEKQKFRALMRMTGKFTGCRVLSYCVMSDHFHVFLGASPRSRAKPRCFPAS